MHAQEGGDAAWERRHSYIIAHYARTWLLIDVIATVPFDIITESADAYGMEVLQAVRVVRLLKLLRVARAARVFARWQTKMSLPYSKQARRDRAEISTPIGAEIGRYTERPHPSCIPQSILIFIVFFLFLCHCMACLWLLVGRMERDLDHINWIDFNLVDSMGAYDSEWRDDDPLAWCAPRSPPSTARATRPRGVAAVHVAGTSSRSTGR